MKLLILVSTFWSFFWVNFFLIDFRVDVGRRAAFANWLNRAAGILSLSFISFLFQINEEQIGGVNIP
jgi:hypothetical protein